MTFETKLLFKPLNTKDNHSKKNNGCIDQFIIFCQPFWQINVEIMVSGIRIFPGNQGDGTHLIEYQQNKSFQNNQTKTYPNPFVNSIYYYRVQKVKYDDIKKKPYKGVQQFDKDKFMI